MPVDVASESSLDFAPDDVRATRWSTFRTAALILALALVAAVALFWQTPPKNGITVIHQPSQELLSRDGVFQWDPWVKEPSEFDWHFGEPEKAYVLEGEATLTPEGSTESVVIRPGDYIRFEPGLRCHWRVTKAFRKLAVGESDAIGAWRWRTTWRLQSIFNRLARLVLG